MTADLERAERASATFFADPALPGRFGLPEHI
jgi:hypothetical protein